MLPRKSATLNTSLIHFARRSLGVGPSRLENRWNYWRPLRHIQEYGWYRFRFHQSNARSMMLSLDSTMVHWYTSPTSATESGSGSGSPTEVGLSLLDMDATDIAVCVKTSRDLEKLVNQLEDMESLTQADIQPLIRPLVQSCWNLSHEKERALSHEKERAADIAERILFLCLSRIPSDIEQRFQVLKASSNLRSLPPYPDIALYNRVMSVVGSLKSEDSANRVHRLFRLMTAEYRAELSYMKSNGIEPNLYPVRAPEPDQATFKTVLRAWSVAGSVLAIKEAENLLALMEELSGLRPGSNQQSQNQKSLLKINPPDIECYNMVLTAYSRVNFRRYPLVFERSVALFRWIQKRQQEEGLRLTWFSYYAILKCVQAKLQSRTRQSLDLAVVQDLEGLIPELCTVSVPDSFVVRSADGNTHPRSWALGIVLEGILQSATEQTRIEAGHLLARRLAGDAPFEVPIAARLDRSQLWPTQESLIVLAKTWRESNLPNREKALEWIRSVALRTTFSSAHQYHLAMNAWKASQDPDAPLVVQSFLDRILDEASHIAPTGETFAIAMYTWAGSKESNRGRKVEEILRNARDHLRRQNRRVNQTHFGLVLKTWQSLGQDGKRYVGKYGLRYPAEHARSHLHSLRSSRQWDPRNYQHYATCLKAWEQQVVEVDDHSTLPAREAENLLEELEQRSGSLPPAPFCNMVLQCCTRDDVPDEYRQEVYNIAIRTFNKGSHDPFSYLLAVTIVKRSVEELGDEHVQFLVATVEAARDAGCLTQGLIFEVVEVLGNKELTKLFHFSDTYADLIVKERSTKLVRPEGKRLKWIGRGTPHALRLDNMPKSWSRNTEYSKSEQDYRAHVGTAKEPIDTPNRSSSFE